MFKAVQVFWVLLLAGPLVQLRLTWAKVDLSDTANELPSKDKEEYLKPASGLEVVLNSTLLPPPPPVMSIPQPN